MIDMINVGKKVAKVCYVTEKDKSPLNSKSMRERIGTMIFTMLRGDTPENCARRNISGIFNIYNGLC